MTLSWGVSSLNWGGGFIPPLGLCVNISLLWSITEAMKSLVYFLAGADSLEAR